MMQAIKLNMSRKQLHDVVFLLFSAMIVVKGKGSYNTGDAKSKGTSSCKNSPHQLIEDYFAYRDTTEPSITIDP